MANTKGQTEKSNRLKRARKTNNLFFGKKPKIEPKQSEKFHV